MVYLEYRDAQGPAPSDIVLAACEAVAAGGEARTRFCARLCPVEATCYASLEKIEELAARVVADHFPAGADQPIEVGWVRAGRRGRRLCLRRRLWAEGPDSVLACALLPTSPWGSLDRTGLPEED